MLARWLRLIAPALVLAAASAAAQAPPPPDGAPPPAPPDAAAPAPTAPAPAAPAPAAPVFAPGQLDQMLASIALYPDPLLTQILTAATYPLEVVDADRWVKSGPNASLRDGQLVQALAAQGWDPSVKSLVPFPQILTLMDQHLDWTQNLGNAFLAQQADVMASIQRLRQAATAAGQLQSTPQASVTQDGPYIDIEPTNPAELYIPVYQPSIYGTWPDPNYPPYFWGTPPGLAIGVTVGGIAFGVGLGIVDSLWNWGDWDWRNHDVRVDPSRFNRINAGRPPITASQWQHDPAHRGGVPYRDAASRARYVAPVAGSAAARRDFRGFAAPAVAAVASAAAARPGEIRGRERPAAVAPAPAARTALAAPARPAASLARPAAAPTTAFHAPVSGAVVRAQAARGAASRQAPVARPAAAARPVAAARPAPAARPAAPAARPAAPAGRPQR